MTTALDRPVTREELMRLVTITFCSDTRDGAVALALRKAVSRV